MFSLTAVKHFAVVLLLFESTQSQDIQGRVNLGSDPSSTISESFLFNVNINSGTLPLYFDLYNVTDDSSATGDAFDEDVVVTCSIITAFTDGDSEIQFTNTGTVPLRNGDTTGTVSFDITSQGRRIEVQCSGETAAAPPGTTSYFSLGTSAGQTGFVTIKKDPVVSLCSDQILVPNADGITTGQVTLKLSEPVETSNVTGICQVTGVQPGEAPWLEFEAVRILSGEDSAVMVYRITGTGSTLQVRCSAESDDGVQFQTALSETGDILFDFESGSVQMFPAFSVVTGDRFTPILALSDPLRTGEADVTFFCQLTPLNTTDEAQDIIDQGECVAPVDGVPGTTDNATTDQMDIITNATLLPNTTSPGTASPAPTAPIPATSAPATPATATPATATPIPTTPDPITTESPTFVPLPTNVPSPANDTATWVLAQPQIVFQEGDAAKVLDIQLRNAGRGFQGGLLVRCCSTPDLNTSPKYTDLSSSVVARMEVAAARSVNWTSATDLQTETPITNPAYTEVSPCPCDLTTNRCDTNCCCDPLCTEDDILAFSCISGIPGGNFTKQHAYNCSNEDIYRPDYFPFLCVQTDNSPFLGLYYTARSGARDAAGYNTLKATPSDIQGTTSFEDTQQRSLDFQNAGSGGYKFGFPVQTLFETNTRGFLALPEADPSGGCSWLSPIQFQVDAASRCDVNPVQGLCTESSVLSARAYALSTNMGYPPCPNAPNVLANYGGSVATPTTVRYHCTDDINPYVVPSTGVSELFPPTGESFFPDNNGSSTVPLPARCAWDDGYTLPPIPDYDEATYLCSSAVLDVRYELFWRGNQIVQLDSVVIIGTVALSPDSSFNSTDENEQPIFVTPPPTEPPTTPTLPDSTTEVTMNATDTDLITVYENYTGPTQQTTTSIQTTATQTTESPTTESPTTESPTTNAPTSQGQTTTDTPTTQSDMTTDSGIVTTDSPINSTNQTNTTLPFTQRFAVTFIHLPTPLTDPAPVDPPEVGTQETLSGNPGYITGERVFSGLAVYDPLVECNDTGDCAPVDPPQPGDFVRIDDAEVNRLRVWVPGPGSLCSQSSLADVTFGEDHTSGCILRLGWTRLSNCTTLREAMLAELQSTVAADRIGKVGNANTSIENNWAPIFNSEEDIIPTEPPPTTVAPTTVDMTTNEQTTPEFFNETQSSPMDLLQGLCYEVPTAVNIEILYAKAGEYGSVIQREILAAYVTYTRSTVKLNCIGADGFACHLDQTSNETTDWVQSFPVASTVTFILTERQSARRCDYDQCDEEMLFLLSLRFQGDSRTYTVAMLMIVVLLTIAYFAITKPWSFII
ncbi:mucin-5AC-like isoform X2 [Patiria miniata]|uniref:Uncharacterized protein n=1 Tax=Patiria miniata TaxID=46514 RepID=A0A913ZPQ4_PATMI|nr:mucin-5AC-like isoform X2 [Patiria miniata]